MNAKEARELSAKAKESHFEKKYRSILDGIFTEVKEAASNCLYEVLVNYSLSDELVRHLEGLGYTCNQYQDGEFLPGRNLISWGPRRNTAGSPETMVQHFEEYYKLTESEIFSTPK